LLSIRSPHGQQRMRRRKMAEGMEEQSVQGRKSKPRFSMDLMIFGNINEINKMIDTHAIEVEGGNLNSLPFWKAGILQLYRNISNFIEDDTKTNMIEVGFKNLDRLIDPYTQTLPSTLDDLKKAILLLRSLNSVIYEERNLTFIKIKRQMADIDKLMDSEFGFLPKAERDEVKKRFEK
jgi:hypothetical protein